MCDGGGYGLIWPSLVDTKFRVTRKTQPQGNAKNKLIGISLARERLVRVRRARICFTRDTTHHPRFYVSLTSVSLCCILHALSNFSSFLSSYLRSSTDYSSAPLSVTYDSLQPLAGHIPRSFSLSSFSSLLFVVFLEHCERDPLNSTLAFPIINNFFAVSRSRTSAPRESWKHSNNHVLFTLFEDVTRPCCERRQHHHRTLSWRPSFRDTRIAERETHTRV